ncbi:MAG: hypothetical protein ACM3SS_14690 [Rhodospirillaceae bacterium]
MAKATAQHSSSVIDDVSEELGKIGVQLRLLAEYCAGATDFDRALITASVCDLQERVRVLENQYDAAARAAAKALRVVA